MNIEALDYALVTAGVGMGIVFFALITLSLMMLLIRSVFADRAASPQSAGDSAGNSAADVTSEPGPNSLDAGGVPRWALAGAVAYLLAEESQMTPYASPWRRRNDEA